MQLSQQNIVPFLTFRGKAEEAMNFYLSVFPDSKLLSLTRIPKDGPGIEGQLLNGTFQLKGQDVMVLDIDVDCPDFSWAMSLFVNCATEEEFDELFAKLSEGGVVMMGPEPVFHMRKVTWTTDKFGVTWQLVWV